jgi:phage gp29-like protein
MSQQAKSNFLNDMIKPGQESRKQQILQNAITAGLNSSISQVFMADLLKEARTKLQVSDRSELADTDLIDI